MSLQGSLRNAVGSVPRKIARDAADRYLANAVDSQLAQQRTLRRVVALNAGSDLSRDLRLDELRTVDELKSRPVSSFDAFQPYVRRVLQGELGAMLGPKNQLLMFSQSSGTTADSKFIPVTKPFITDYRAGWQIWGIRALDSYPAISLGSILQLSSDHDRFRSEGGIPCGNISGLVAKLQNPLVRTMYCVPRIVAKIRDPELKTYVTLRLALADSNVRLVATANPSTLIQLAKAADRNAERLIRDIYDGTCWGAAALPSAVGRRLAWRMSRPDTARARKLEAIFRATDGLAPKYIWPQLQLVGVWTGGCAGMYLPELRELYGPLPIRDHGLHASEGRMTIPLDDNRSDGLLDVGSHVFEFIPEREYESEQPTTLQPHELEVGQDYYILLTTASGLTRYDICDVVRCTGFLGTTPLLEFRHKGAHISNITGEKLTESQAVEAVGHASRRLGIDVGQFSIAPAWGDPPGYRLVLEGGTAVEKTLPIAVDTALQRLNTEYRDKRQSGRLTTLQAETLPPGTWRRFARRRQDDTGASVEQYKHPFLSPDFRFIERIRASAAGALAIDPEFPRPHVGPAEVSA
ncbi:GH3 auxin-responsive promoter family protein [Stratiformator vulcanicus]|uniref:GH3 auxin-responsive promoter n=1 Tax=Stratiformator vulcanicus TaxID=2527980 RepID=A0A517QX70_9PLAN|nr:GH3 auxin-responsive promoter family protein [Stratiformator vulcanicus]QDT36170.1 GH3 auxin-responsive promoter [Stratiformator vulcanicus]